MAAPFYVDNDVPLSFDVTDDAGDINPTSATVDVWDPTGTQIVTADSATVSTNNVSYSVSDLVVLLVGTYVANFHVILPTGDVRTHSITFAAIVVPDNS